MRACFYVCMRAGNVRMQRRIDACVDVIMHVRSVMRYVYVFMGMRARMHVGMHVRLYVRMCMHVPHACMQVGVCVCVFVSTRGLQ